MIVVDGIKVKVNVSCYKVMSYKCMKLVEDELYCEIKVLFDCVKVIDDQECNELELDIFVEIFCCEKCLEVIQVVKVCLEVCQCEVDQVWGCSEDDGCWFCYLDGLDKGGGLYKCEFGVLDDCDQESFIDLDSWIMKYVGGGFEQSYNGYIVVDVEYQIIVVVELINCVVDSQVLLGMLVVVQVNIGEMLVQMLVDVGFCSEVVLVKVVDYYGDVIVVFGCEGCEDVKVNVKIYLYMVVIVVKLKME